MGELVAGTPALQLDFRTAPPLDLISALSLLYRAVPGSGLNPWLVATRRALPADLRADLDLIHGFSGRLLYYTEEPVMRFGPFPADDRDVSVEDFLAHLETLPPMDYQVMAADALRRVHRDLGLDLAPPRGDDEVAWRRCLEPALTTATADAALALILAPECLKERTVALFRGVWEHAYRAEHARWAPALAEAVRLAAPAADRGFGQAFADLTGSRLPAPLVAGLDQIARVTFCPSPHLGTFVSYIRYPPDLVVFFDAPRLLERLGTSAAPAPPEAAPATAERADLDAETLIEGLRALADPNRLRILDLLGAGELYAQEVVGRLGIAQSAVSRHLAALERAGVVRVRPRGGMKYYAVAPERLDALAEAVRTRGRSANSVHS